MSSTYNSHNRFREGQRVFIGEGPDNIDDAGEIVEVNERGLRIHFFEDDVKLVFPKKEVRESIAEDNWFTDGTWY